MASRRNARKRRKRKGLFGPLFKILGILAAVVAVTMGATVFFQVETVTVLGNSRYTQEQVIETAGIRPGSNLFRMNKYQIASRVLEELPYIKELTIRRELPSGVIITMTEWDAVAQVKALSPEVAAELNEANIQQELEAVKKQLAKQGEEKLKEFDEAAEREKITPLEFATEDWLISVGGKLLESAGETEETILVTGLTLLPPVSGKAIPVPEEEQPRVDGLTALLTNLEKLELLENVSSIQLTASSLTMRYMNRFDVKMPLNADFYYKLRVLTAAVAETEKKLGGQVNGTFDLTQAGTAAVFSPLK